MTEARIEHAGAPLADGRVLVSGGLTPTQYLASAEIFDPAAGAWTAVAPMTVPRAKHTATLLDAPVCETASPPGWCGQILVAGGINVGTAEVFDPLLGSWTPVGSMAGPRASHTATPLTDGRVLVVGGSANGSLPALATAEIYDPYTATWSATGSLNVRRLNHTATVLGDGRVLAAGGIDALDGSEDPRPGSEPILQNDRAPLRSAEIWDSATGAWTQAPAQAQGRELHTANLLGDGNVLVAGGDDLNSRITGDSGPLGARPFVELFDAPAGPWEDLNSRWLNDGRSSHTTTSLPDGRLLAAAGNVQGVPGPSAEVYDPATGRWGYTGPLQSPRAGQLAFLLLGPGCSARCGQVLVAGGKTATAQRVASAELYDPAAPTFPGGVKGLAAQVESHSRLKLSFEAAGAISGYRPPASRYVVKQSQEAIDDAADFGAAQALCGGVCAFEPAQVGDTLRLTLTGLKPETRYYYAVQALDGDNHAGPISASVSASTDKDTIAPGRVKKLAAKALSAKKIRLRFGAAGSDGDESPPARLYEVRVASRPIKTAQRFRQADNLCRPFCRFGPSRVGARLSLIVKRLQPATRYHFAIRARDDSGNVGPRARFGGTSTRP